MPPRCVICPRVYAMGIPRTTALVLVALAWVASACTRERSRAVQEEDMNGGARDYREMLAQVRERQQDEQVLVQIRQAIERFQFNLARMPTNLHELLVLGYLDEAPQPPRGQAFTYDPIHGNVRLITTDDSGAPVLPESVNNESRARLIEVNLPPPE